jgi:hypothetical protein
MEGLMRVETDGMDEMATRMRLVGPVISSQELCTKYRSWIMS